jgi:hypothetical protein
MMKKAFVAMALAGMAMSAQATVVINQGFSDVASLASQGWVFTNAGTPDGVAPGWVQGAQNVFAAQSGAANSYASASFTIAPEGGDIDSWLLTSAFDASKGATVSFFLRAAGEGYADQVNFGFVNADGSLTGLALTTVNPVPDTGWVKYTAWVGADTLSASTRFGFEYVGSYDTANYVGLDTLVVDVPEPASMMLIAGGLLGLGAARRRSRA